MCEDYRAGLGIDRRHDDEDRAAERRVQCRTLVLWGTKSDLPLLYADIYGIWQNWVAGELTAKGIGTGHHIAEEAPAELGEELRRAWAGAEATGHGA